MTTAGYPSKTSEKRRAVSRSLEQRSPLGRREGRRGPQASALSGKKPAPGSLTAPAEPATSPRSQPLAQTLPLAPFYVIPAHPGVPPPYGGIPVILHRMDAESSKKKKKDFFLPRVTVRGKNGKLRSFKLGKKLGSGGYGDIFAGADEAEPTRQVAVKLGTEHGMKMLQREAKAYELFSPAGTATAPAPRARCSSLQPASPLSRRTGPSRAATSWYSRNGCPRAVAHRGAGDGGARTEPPGYSHPVPLHTLRRC